MKLLEQPEKVYPKGLVLVQFLENFFLRVNQKKDKNLNFTSVCHIRIHFWK